MSKIKRLVIYYFKEIIAGLFFLIGGVYILNFLTRNKPCFVVLNYHNFSKYNNYRIKRGNILDTGYSANFEKQVKFLKKYFRFCYPEDFFEDTTKKGINILITFDDGYKDNYDIAFPILKKYNAKVIFFIVTNIISTKYWLKHDQLRYLVTQGVKQEAEVEHLLKKMNKGISIEIEYNELVSYLQKPNHRLMMNWEEIKDLKEAGFNIASHTHNHAVLPFLSLNQQNNELITSIRLLKTNLGNSSHYFAYPNGLFTQGSIDLLKSNKIKYSFSTISGINLKETNQQKIKRIGINVSDSVGVVLLKIILNIIK